MSTTMQLPPSSPSSEVDDVSYINDESREAESSAASDTDLAQDADDDDDEQQHSKKKIFGKKKIMRRKKYTKNNNTSTGGTATDNAILHGIPSSPDEPSGLDDSIVGSPPQTNIHQHKQKRQRAKVAMYPTNKYMEDSESDYL